MHIVLDGEGKGEVDDVIDVRNVEAARRHVCRHQQRDLSALKILHRQGPAINNSSVADTEHFGVDPDPRIYASDYWIRIRLFSSFTFKTPTKNYFF